jgi:hypothetical protein
MDTKLKSGDHQSSREMIDSLAEELDEICARMRRTTSSQSGGFMNKFEDEFASNNQVDNYRYRSNKKMNVCPDPKSSDRDRLKLDLYSHEEDETNFPDLATFVKTPMSPSKAGICPAGEKESFCDHQLYFDMDMSMDSSQDFVRSSTKRIDSSFINQKEDSSGFSSSCTSEISHPSHRAIHKFVPRHKDEIMLEVGDPIHVEYEAEDHWCQGTNLRTGQTGIFPLAHVFEVDFEDVGPVTSLGLPFHEKDTFYLTYLATVEVAHHKGNDVLVQAINKVLQAYQTKEDIVVPSPVLLDISFRGVHLIDKSKKTWFRCPNFDYFYSLQNISFCGAHPKQLRYFGFITKHPLLPKFACHVFMSKTSTEPVVEAVGRAFQRSYNEYMAFSHPTEDIYFD